MFKTGVVTEVSTAKCAARVQFPDNDGVVSFWLPLLQHKSLKDRYYFVPDVNEHVACLLDDNGEAGVILGAIYSEADAPPVDSADKYHVTFEDGTILEYDRKAHRLFADIKGDVEVKATGKCDVAIDGKTTYLSKGTMDIDGGSGGVSGVVTQKCICPFTGRPHSDYSTDVKASKG